MTEAVRQIPAMRWSGRLPSRYVFGVGYAIAATMTAIGAWLAASAPSNPISGPNTGVVTVLWVNLLLILALAGWVGWRVFAVFASRDKRAGAKLHLYFVTMFAGAAAIPSIVVALFFGLLVNRGVESWFSETVRSAIDNAGAVSESYKQDQSDLTRADANAIVQEADPALGESREEFERFLQRQMQFRGLAGIYILDGAGQRKVEAVGFNAPPFKPLTAEQMQAAAAARGPYFPESEPGITRVVLQPRNWRDIGDAPLTLLVVRKSDPGILRMTSEVSGSVAAFHNTAENRRSIQATFLLSYVETALLVIVGAIWFGMRFATGISRPIARLVDAADRVAGGDLGVRVETGDAPPEIEVLSGAFNRMTDDLETQQAALRQASVDAESRRQFIETVLSGVSAGVLSLDAQGRISACNRQAIKLLSLDQGSTQGVTLTHAAPELAAVVAEADDAGEAETDIDILRGPETRRLRVRAAALPEGGLVLTFDDITRLMTAQRNAAWRDVARRIAHEIKNPLTPIQLSAERLRRKYRKEITSDVETFDRCTDTIVRQVGDIGRMVDEFSAFARMPAPRFHHCDPAEMLREAVFARRVAAPDIIFELIDPPDGAELVCDDRLVGQALGNVLKNAAESVAARKDSKEPGRVTARLLMEDHAVTFEVTDNGVGLPVRDRDRLSEPYVTNRDKGTGLGLAIVKRIVEDHGGVLTLTDAPTAPGARVTLTFPRGRPVGPAHAMTEKA